MNAVATTTQPTNEQALTQLLLQREKAFNNVLSVKQMDFKRECTFARQQILKTDFATKMAFNNQQSLQNAITNVAAIGLTLNPASAYAYLVPRDGGIMLDISYRGLCKLATDTGVIKWVRAEMVYSADTFRMQGLSSEPIHDFDGFADVDAGERGEFRGVYCVAKTIDGDYLTDRMSAAEVYKIRDLSQAYTFAVSKGKSNSVWHLWFSQMAIKTVLKRASKLWPVSDGSERLHAAVNLLNEQDGSAPLEPTPPRGNVFTPEQKQAFDAAVASSDGPEIWHMGRSLDKSVWIDLYNSGEKGQKVKLKATVDALGKEGLEEFKSTAIELAQMMESSDELGASQLLEELPEGHRETLDEQMDTDLIEWLDSLEP